MELGDGAAEAKRTEVVFVGPKSFPPVIGGIETHVYEVAKRLAARGFAVTVIVPRSGAMLRREQVDGVDVVRVWCLKSRYLLKLTAMPGIIRELRRRRAAVVHAHDATGGCAASVSVPRARLVYTMHGVGFHEKDWPTPFRQGIRIMQKRTLKRAAHVFCTDQVTLETVKKLGRESDLLSSGVDVSQFDSRALPRPKEYSPDARIVLFVGRMTKVKGANILLEAIRMMDAGIRRKARFVFIGDGPLEADVRSASSEVKEILFLGQIEHEMIRPYFAHADIFVLPSLSEGVPISLLEAMASAVPCIATKVGGVDSAIDHSMLKLVPPGDPRALADQLTSLLENGSDARALGERARAYVSDHYSWDKVVDRLAETYERLSRA